MQGAWGQSLVLKLRSHMLCDVVKKKKKITKGDSKIYKETQCLDEIKEPWKRTRQKNFYYLISRYNIIINSDF